MKSRIAGTVVLPRTPREGMNGTPWAIEVNRCLQQLRDRFITSGKNRKSGASNIKPLTIINGTDIDKFKIIPGYVNGIMPTLGGTALDNATPPEFTVTATVSVYAKVVGTFGTPDTYVRTIHVSGTVPTDSVTATDFTSYYLIGDVAFTAGSPATYEIYNFHSGGHLGVESFGSVNLWWRL